MDSLSAIAKATRLRTAASECRSLARLMSLREDAAKLEDMADRYEREARAIEAEFRAAG
jgi:hypothetical protein